MDLNELKETLLSLGYEVSVFENKDEVREYFKTNVVGKTIGFGGSISLKELSLHELLKENNEVIWHWNSDVDRNLILKQAMTSQIYISSVNALSKNGEIVNIDGTGNRVASTIYGHEKVYFVIGKNKITENLEQAIYRARNVAAPLNAKRLNKKTPCVVDLKCHDCKSPERICRAFSILYPAPKGCKYEIVLVNEDLGY